MSEFTQRAVMTIDGRKLLFEGDPADAYFQGLEAFHANSPEFEGYLAQHVGPDSVCIDVGANIGLTTLLMAHYCSAGHVYAFEASPRNAGYLRRNLALNGMANCTVIETAVGARTGRIQFRECVYAAGSHVVSAQTVHAGGHISAQVTTLDAMFPVGVPRPRIRLIKVDVEGFEPAVLSGAADLLAHDRSTVFMEFNAWCLQRFHGFNPFVFAHALASRFEMKTVEKDGATRPVSVADVDGFLYRNIMQKGCVDDIVLTFNPAAGPMPSVAEMTKGVEDLRNFKQMELTDRATAPRARPLASQDKIPDLQYLRGIAILLVLAAHLSLGHTLLGILPSGSANPGWIGVELFFVVSGFVVVQSFFRAGLSVPDFGTRRLFRLYPLLVVSLALAALAKILCDYLVAGAPPLFSPSWDVFWRQSLAILSGTHPDPQWGVSYANHALWSLSVEIRFYVALAVLVAVLNFFVPLVRTRRHALLLVAVLVCGAGWTARVLECFGVPFPPGQVVSASMYDFIALGVVTALLPAKFAIPIARLARPARPVLLLAILSLITVVGNPHTIGPSRLPLFQMAMIAVSIMLTLIVLGSARCDEEDDDDPSPLRLFIESVGERSYAIFLLHLPVFTIVWALGVWLGWSDGYWRWPIFELCLSMLLLVPLVELAYRWIELPMIASGKDFARWVRDEAIPSFWPGAVTHRAGRT